MTLKSYNGFTPAERRTGGRAVSKALADGRLSYADACSVCARTLTAPHQFHSETYHEPLSAYPVCRRCHYAIHIRFRRPQYWQRFLGELSPEAWVHQVTVDPASLTQPFCDTYPSGFPPDPLRLFTHVSERWLTAFASHASTSAMRTSRFMPVSSPSGGISICIGVKPPVAI